MTYYAPYLWVTGHFTTAADLNQQIYNYNLGSAVYLFTTAGDTLYASATNVPARLGIGASGTILGSSGTAPQWVATTTITAVGTLTGLAVNGAVDLSSQASASIRGGTVSLLLNNSAGTFTNIQILDAGAITVRSTISGVTTLTATTVTATNLGGTLTTAAQPNITSINSASLAVGGPITIGANGATNAIQLVLNGTSGSNRTIQLQHAGIVVAGLAVASSNTYFDYIGNLYFRDSPAFSTNRMTLSATGALTTTTSINSVAGNFTGDVTCSRLDLSSSTGLIFGGATSTTIRNSGDSADNCVFADAGNVTFRSGSVLSGITTVTATNLGGTLTTAAQPNVTSISPTTQLSFSGSKSNTSGVYVGSALTSSDGAGFVFGIRNSSSYTITSTPTLACGGYFGDPTVSVSAAQTLPRMAIIYTHHNAKTGSGTLTNNSHIHMEGTPSGGATTNYYISTNQACNLDAAGTFNDTSHEFEPDGSRWKVRRGNAKDALDPIDALRRIEIHRYDLTDKVPDDVRNDYIAPFAEELHAVNPLLSRDGRTVNGVRLASFAILASQSQQEEIDSLKAELADLRELITNRRN